MQYQWYPGHMTKAMRMMKENIRLVDLVIELTDARVVRSGRNPDIDALCQKKARIVILNKADLADESVNALWKTAYEAQGFNVLALNSKDPSSEKRLKEAIKSCMEDKKNADIARGITGRPVRAMVAGIPNVGKSTLINCLNRRASTKTGNRPGITKGKQWITLSDSTQLLDTPGVLWPKFEDPVTGMHLAFVGSMNDDNIDKSDLALQFIVFLLETYPGLLEERYALREEQVDEKAAEALSGQLLIPDARLRSALPYLYAVAANRNLVKKKAAPDTERAANMILEDFRSGKLGRISIERP